MICLTSLPARLAAYTTVFGILNMTVPTGLVGTYGPAAADTVAKYAQPARQEEVAPASRPLTAKEQGARRGRIGEQPYIAGGFKWSVNYKGVDAITGNYSLSATDLSFEGGYGVPVSVTRSYSSNNPDEGPFGKGWSLSADVRSTAGGVLKSSSGAVRSVPVSFKERPSLQDDPNLPTTLEPTEAVLASDASGTEETIQKDADGVLTTPAWDKNTIDSEYEWQVLNGQRYHVLLSNTVRTPEGTLYTYQKMGSYPNGTKPYYNPNATAEAANVLKVTSVTDRHGNATTYTYDTSRWVTFNKANGQTQERPLVGVQMPNGHTLTFVWGTGAANSANPTDRIWKVYDNAQARTVTYTYANRLLATVTTPAGRTTSFGYAGAWSRQGFLGDVASDLLSTITDPRGLTTEIKYAMATNNLSLLAPVVYRINHPNGLTRTIIEYNEFQSPETTPPDGWGTVVGPHNMRFEEVNASNGVRNSFAVTVDSNTTMPDPDGGPNLPIRKVTMHDGEGG